MAKRFGRTEALRGIDLVVDPGDLFGYLGPKGASKTTTLRPLLGLTRPTSGRVDVLGLDAWRHRDELHRRVGYVPGETALYPRLTGQEHVDFVGHLHGMGRPSAVTGQPPEARAGPDPIRPQLLVLDEPSSGLDPLLPRKFHALLTEHAAAGGTALLSSHVLREIQRVTSRIGVLREGRVIAVDELDSLRAKSLHPRRGAVRAARLGGVFAALDGVRDVRVDQGSFGATPRRRRSTRC